MNSFPATEYDRVVYPSALHAQTHPERLATLGMLLGLRPAPVTACRVLELGCGDGMNLIAMAADLPASHFVGFDLAAKPVEQGRRMVERMGATNVELRQADVLQLPENLGTFDYIIAHGLFSWAPAAVRERLLQVCGTHLAEQGIAYVSYNAYPGNYLRDIARGLMRFHADGFEDPRERVQQARAILKFVAGAQTKPGLWSGVLRQQAERLDAYSVEACFHDDLGPINQPFHFHEFMGLASRYGLQFLAEADLTDLHRENLTPEAISMLAQVEDNIVAREQYLDFMIGRSFRQTLLCRRELKLDRELDAAAVRQLYAAGDTAPTSGQCDVRSQALEEFRGLKRAVIATSNPLIKAALVVLGRRWPSRVAFDDLFRQAYALATGEAVGDRLVPGFEPAALANALLQSALSGFLELHAHPTSCVGEVSERPRCSPLSRQFLDCWQTIPTPLHQPVKLEGSLSRALVRLLDGTRDRAALVRDLTAAVLAGSAEVRRDSQPVTDPDAVKEILAAELDNNLQSLAKLGLLVG